MSNEVLGYPGEPQRQQGQQAGQEQPLQAAAEGGGRGHARIVGLGGGGDRASVGWCETGGVR